MSQNNEFVFHSIEDAIHDYRNGKVVIVVDDEDRENEGDFIMAAEKVTPEAINFMAKYGRGLICLAITAQRARELELDVMVNRNTALHATHFTVSIDAKEGTTTGISAYDRAVTIRSAIDPKTRPDDLARPGHIFPLVSKPGGVLERSGHTEATVDLARLAGLYPAGVLCEIMDEDGSMARVPRLMEIARQFDLKIITIKDLIHYRLKQEKFVRAIVKDEPLESAYGHFKLMIYENLLNGDRHLVVYQGDIHSPEPLLVRVHTERIMADVFRSLKFDDSGHISHVLRMIEKEGRGLLIYLSGSESLGLELDPIRERRSLDSHHTEDTGKDWRTLGVGSQILVDLGIQRIRLLSNTMKKYVGLEGYRIEITEIVPIR